MNFKCGISDENLMINVLNILTKEQDMILDGFGNCHMSDDPDALITWMICEKSNHCYKKIKNNKEESKKQN